MSGIFGGFNLDGQPIDPAILRTMQKSMPHFGPDRSDTWSESFVGLGHLLRFDTPESVNEKLPLINASGHVLTAAARLDNRTDLFSHLSIAHAEQNETTDGSLILKAYEKWGTKCTGYLLGDWCFAIWDKHQHHLFLARDHLGTSSLYYYRDNSKFLFSSSIKALLTLNLSPRLLDPLGLARQFPGFPRDESTPYKNIKRLTFAQQIKVTTTNLVVENYWQPSDFTEVRFRSDQEYLEAFNNIFTESINCRLRTYRPVGVLLSGGLDSGSIATLAAQKLSNNNQCLSAFSSIPFYDTTNTIGDNQIGDETPLIDAICQFSGSINCHYINASTISPVTGIQQGLELMGQPDFAPTGIFWFLAILKAAQQQNHGALLMGDGGNFTATWSGNREDYLLSLLKNCQWQQYIQEVSDWHSINKSNLLRTIKSQIFSPLMPLNFQRNSFGKKSIYNNSPLNDEVIQHLLQENKNASDNKNSFLSHLPHSLKAVYSLFRNTHTAPYSELAAAFNLDIRSPMRDIRLVNFCLGIPQDQFTRNGHDRLLIRRAMTGKMPENVTWNTKRGTQSADIMKRCAVSQKEIIMTIKQLEKSPLCQQYLNIKKLNVISNQLQTRSDPEFKRQVGKLLLRGIMIGLFLQRFESE